MCRPDRILVCLVHDFATEQLVCLKAEAEGRDNPTQYALNLDELEIVRLRALPSRRSG